MMHSWIYKSTLYTYLLLEKHYHPLNYSSEVPYLMPLIGVKSHSKARKLSHVSRNGLTYPAFA